MKRVWLVVGMIVLVVVLGGAAFVGVRLVMQQAQAKSAPATASYSGMSFRGAERREISA